MENMTLSKKLFKIAGFLAGGGIVFWGVGFGDIFPELLMTGAIVCGIIGYIKMGHNS